MIYIQKSTQKQALYWMFGVVAGVIIGSGVQLVQAWTAPTQAPPGGNVAGPITTGASQAKSGQLWVNNTSIPSPFNSFASYPEYGLAVGGKAFITGSLGVADSVTISGDIDAGKTLWIRGDLVKNYANNQSITPNDYPDFGLLVGNNIGVAGKSYFGGDMNVNAKITSASTQDSDAANTTVTKDYLDRKLAELGGLLNNMTTVQGPQATCPAGKTAFAYKWTTSSCSNYGNACALHQGWSGTAPSCESCVDWEKCHMCSSTEWDAVMCM